MKQLLIQLHHCDLAEECTCGDDMRVKMAVDADQAREWGLPDWIISELERP